MCPPSATQSTELQRRLQGRLTDQYLADFAPDCSICIGQLLRPDELPAGATMDQPLFPQLIG